MTFFKKEAFRFFSSLRVVVPQLYSFASICVIRDLNLPAQELRGTSSLRNDDGNASRGQLPAPSPIKGLRKKPASRGGSTARARAASCAHTPSSRVPGTAPRRAGVEVPPPLRGDVQPRPFGGSSASIPQSEPRPGAGLGEGRWRPSRRLISQNSQRLRGKFTERRRWRRLLGCLRRTMAVARRPWPLLPESWDSVA